VRSGDIMLWLGSRCAIRASISSRRSGCARRSPASPARV